jgi:site-specific DNA-cytosine methylase
VNESKPTHLDLFTGTGAFSIAFEAEGFETIGFSEIDEYCCKLLAQNWPHVKNYGDIRNVPAVRCSVLTAGIPCQAISGAGLQLGEADYRYLWKPSIAAIERCRQDWCVIENVINVTNLFLASWQDDLEALGYKSQAFDIPSCAVGLSTMERHVWLIAASDEIQFARMSTEDVPHFRSQKGEVCFEPTFSPTAGMRDGWNLPPSRLLRSLKGFPNGRYRIEAIGNAIPPPIARLFAHAIRKLI